MKPSRPNKSQQTRRDLPDPPPPLPCPNPSHPDPIHPLPIHHTQARVPSLSRLADHAAPPPAQPRCAPYRPGLPHPLQSNTVIVLQARAAAPHLNHVAYEWRGHEIDHVGRGRVAAAGNGTRSAQGSELCPCQAAQNGRVVGHACRDQGQRGSEGSRVQEGVRRQRTGQLHNDAWTGML